MKKQNPHTFKSFPLRFIDSYTPRSVYFYLIRFLNTIVCTIFLFELSNSHIKTNTYTHTFVPTPTVTASHKREKFLLSLNKTSFLSKMETSQYKRRCQKCIYRLNLMIKGFLIKNERKLYGKTYFLDIIVAYSPLQGC